jgi:hypothetical protein
MGPGYSTEDGDELTVYATVAGAWHRSFFDDRCAG